MNSARSRKPHAALEKEARYRKGRKIERLLDLGSEAGPLRLLEVGAGSGWISHYFAHAAHGRYEVYAVDVVDSRQSGGDYGFMLVEGTMLPFEDATFDVVISNHVIEHVGNDVDQMRHLAELLRVLKPAGIGYLAVPNRWMLIEPHYRVAFLSWWPESWRSAWLQLWRKGKYYDCRPLACNDLEARLERAGFSFTQLHEQALRATFEIESPSSPIWRLFLGHLPKSVWSITRRMLPTLIFRLGRP